jgi:hypothetical protein
MRTGASTMVVPAARRKWSWRIAGRFDERLGGRHGFAAGIGFLVLLGAATPGAQVPMPDLRQMSGVPLPSADVPDGVVSVRVVRGALSNNLVNHPVELHVNGTVLTARTDDTGRAQFRGLVAGTRVHAVALVDGERLESQPFEIPARGGIRVLLAASGASREPAQAPSSPQPGTVVLGGESRFVVELDEEAVRVFALLDLVNPARAPVAPAGPIVFEMPHGAQGTSVLEGSSAQATANGPRVTVTGPFQPGTTPVRFAYLLPYSGSRLRIAQRLPVALEMVAVIVEQRGGLRVRSPHIERIEEMTASGRRFLVGGGRGLAAGAVLDLTLEGLPHPPAWPRLLALGLAGLVVVWGVGLAFGAPAASATASRRALERRREQLFDELVRLEADYLGQRRDDATYRRRRDDLMARLERIYAQLDGAGAWAGAAARPRSAREAVGARRSSAAG